MNLVQIAKSWYSFAQGSDYTKLLMEKRLKVCDPCPHKKQMNKLGIVISNKINEDGSIYKCGLCDCPLSALTAHPANKCKDNRWGVAGT